MFCPKCGQQLEDNSSFCVYCGTKMQQENEPYMQQTEGAYDEPLEPSYQETVYNGPEYEEYPPRKAAYQKKSDVSVFSHIAAVCACVLIFLILLAGTCILTVRQSTTEEAIEEIVKSIEIADIRVDNIVDDSDDGMTLAEYVHDCINDQLVEKYNMSESNIEELLQDNDLRDFVSEKVSDCFDYIYNGGSAPKVKSSEVIKLLQKNEKTIKKITGYEMKEKDYEEIKEAMEEGQLDALDMSNITSEYGSTFEMVRIGLSYGCLIVLCVLMLVFCVLIFLLYRHRIASAFLSIGVTAALAGIGELLLSLFTSTFVTSLCDSLSLPSQAIRPVVEQVSVRFTSIAAIITGVGAALIVIHIVIKICIKNFRKE